MNPIQTYQDSINGQQVTIKRFAPSDGTMRKRKVKPQHTAKIDMSKLDQLSPEDKAKVLAALVK